MRPIFPLPAQIEPPQSFKIVKNESRPVSNLARYVDHSSLNSCDSPESIRTLCEQGIEKRVAAICTYPLFLPVQLACLAESGVKTCVVAGGFPSGLASLESTCQEVTKLSEMGAQEIDMVIPRYLAVDKHWQALHTHLCEIRKASRNSILKLILATGDLPTPDHIFQAALVAAFAGADFLKTSTGFETVNATQDSGRILAQAALAYSKATGHPKPGVKVSGGIKTTQFAQDLYWAIADEWQVEELHQSEFRIGASSLLAQLQA